MALAHNRYRQMALLGSSSNCGYSLRRPTECVEERADLPVKIVIQAKIVANLWQKLSSRDLKNSQAAGHRMCPAQGQLLPAGEPFRDIAASPRVPGKTRFFTRREVNKASIGPMRSTCDKSIPMQVDVGRRSHQRSLLATPTVPHRAFEKRCRPALTSRRPPTSLQLTRGSSRDAEARVTGPLRRRAAEWTLHLRHFEV
jgi:hypothetical protein